MSAPRPEKRYKIYSEGVERRKKIVKRYDKLKAHILGKLGISEKEDDKK